MPRGAAVVKYDGTRGRVWRIKYVDAAGEQTMETLGREAEGWDRKRAESELRARLVDVEREGLRKIKPVTFASLADEWIETYPAAKTLKRSTEQSYKSIIRLHLKPAFGPVKLQAIDVTRLERYIAEKRAAGFGPRTINRHLNLLNLIFAAAVRRKLRRDNPVRLVERPREPRRRWRILSPVEIGRVERAFSELGAEADGEERRWREQGRVIFLTLVGAGLRRGEILGLRWRDIELADPAGPNLRVRATWVRSGEDTPKSAAGERTIPLGPRLAEELFEHRGRSTFQGDDERVFISTERGTPFDVARYAETFRAALKRAKITDYIRPFHDLRHTAITNDAASGNAPMAVMTRAGHSDFKTTQGYIDLAGVSFREEAERLERRLLGEGAALKDEADMMEGVPGV